MDIKTLRPRHTVEFFKEGIVPLFIRVSSSVFARIQSISWQIRQLNAKINLLRERIQWWREQKNTWSNMQLLKESSQQLKAIYSGVDWNFIDILSRGIKIVGSTDY